MILNVDKLDELYKRATVDTYGHGAFGESCTYREVDHATLVEIVVGDCIEVIRDVLRNDPNSTLSYADASLIQQRLRQTFGAEEGE